jgi:hypothetical protein
MVQQFKKEEVILGKGDGMIRSIRSKIALALLAWTILMATTGCAMFQPKPEPQRPRTVEEWMAQPRVPM